jgi:hypothetical protein
VNTTVKLNKAGANKYIMRIESYQIFAQLLEGYVNEASTTMSLIANNPGGKEVVQKLHKDMSLAHDIGYRPVDKISWSELKDSYRGAWVIIQGTKGTGAIRARGGSTGSYEAVASTGGETRSVSDGRGGNIIDFLKGEIGKLNKFYVAPNTTAVSDKQKKRRDAQKGAGSTEVTQSTLVAKFKPLWSRAITASIADIKGHIANMIKNDAFEKAKRKLNYIETLQNGLEQLEAGNADTPGFLSSAINSAVLMTASHYYPETTGDLNRSRYGSSAGVSAQFNEGPAQLLKDIAGGDQKKLGTVLSFFKRSLISG